MIKQLVEKNNSYSFDFVLPEEDELKQNDFGIIFRGICDQNGKPVIIRYIADTQLIKNEQHLQLVQRIFMSLSLLHEGIVAMYGCFKDDDGIYIAREQLQGIDLQTVIFSGDYPHLRNTKYMLRVGEKICEILSVLHANKIIHRRIQPSNIFLETNELGQFDLENPKVKLLNFEYAQINGQNILGFQSIPYALYYSAPEQVLQANVLVNQTSDLYSLGITLYEAIARQHAFICDKEDNNLLLNMQLSFPLKKNYRMSKAVFAFLQKATAKHIFNTPPMRYKPEARLKFFLNAQSQRFQSADTMKNTLLYLIQNEPDTKEFSLLDSIKKVFRKK